jgi:PKD repeat protein
VAVVNGPRISGATLPTLSINNIAASDAGSYFLRATGSCGTSVTNSASLIVQDRITITQQPKSTTACPGSTLTLNVIASGTVTDYTWKLGAAIVGTGTTYSVSPFVAATHAGNYTVELTNICETVVSDIAIVSAGVPTTATVSSDITECEGGNASFSITATGSNLTYQWYKGATLLSDNARIGGSNTATLTISGLIPSDAATYQCDVSGSCGFDNDNSAALTVNQNVAITIQPASTSALVGTNPTFTVVASGSITGYQWYKGAAAIGDGALYSGTTTPTLTVLDAQAADAGSYSCEVSGICGNRTSNSATLTVIPASGIITQPVTPVAVCETSNFSINIVATAGAHTYQWRRDAVVLSDGVRISGSTTSVLTVTGVVSGDAGAYTCLLDGSEISSASVVTVKPSTAITAHPAGGTKCTGDMHIFSVTAAGANLNYQWYKDDIAHPVAGATLNEYTINPLAFGDNGTYFCVVTADCGQKTSNPATLTVNIPISVVAHPATPTTLCQGNSTSLFFNVTGTNLTYLWNKNGQPITDANITGINTNTLVITNSVVSNTGSYTCTVSGLCSTPVTSNAALVTVNPVTAISTQPISRVKCENEAVTFTVTATGTNLHYTWQLNGGAILGAPDNPVYTIPVLAKATHEGNYTCVIHGDCGPDVTSDIATLTVYRNTSIGVPVISSTPVCQNGNTNISVTATGDNLTYLWKKDGLAITSGNVTGITSNTLVISNASVTDAGVYTCTVTGACGSPQTSVNATIAVDPTTAITSQPSNYTKCAGDEVIFTVAATGAGLTYQWKIGGAAGADVSEGLQASGATISGATTNQMKISGTTVSEAGSYACVVTGACGSVNSDPASLAVNIPVAITVQPSALTQVCQGSSTEINVTSSGTALQYKWKKGTTYLVNGGSISGVNTSKLVISNALISDAGFYSCEISNTCNTVNTQSAELRVNPLPAFTVNPTGATLCEGENIQLMVTATGAAPILYQWQFNAADIIGATSSTFTINGLASSNSGAYTCIITPASCGSATSTPAVLTVNPAVDISIHPANASVCQGTTAILSVTATGTAPLSYQWKFNNTPLSNGGRISGATSNELRISLAADADEGIYKCDITSGCGTETSGSAILSVDPATAITVQPLSQTIVAGTDAIFSISAAGIITNYQWQRNGSPITDGLKYSGTGTPILTVKAVAVSDEASYRCIVTGSCGTVNSNLGVLKVVVPVTISASTGDQTKCTTESASFSVVAAGTISTYQWIFNGSNIVDGGVISGATTPNLVISSVTSSHEGNYACVVTGTYNVAISDVATLTVNDPPVITIHPVTQTLCVHDWLVLEVTATGDGLSYEWEKNGSTVTADPKITGINNSLLVITDIDPSFAGIYRCRVWNGCQTRWSNDAVITINPSMALLTNPSPSETKCEGQTVTFSVTTSGVNVLYQWYKGGVAITNTTRITGAQTKNLTITGIVAGDADSYSCVVTDNCNSINSTTGGLTVRENVVISSQPVNQTVCEGQNAFFNVAATGYNLVYTWQKNGAAITDPNISGINTSTLVITNATTANTGVYRCFLDGECNDILTGTANLTVNALPAAPGAVTGNTTLCQGTKGVLYTVPVIANATTYVWSLPYNATIVSGAGTRSITVDYLAGSLSGTVSVHGVNGCADGPESAALSVTVHAVPTAAAGPDQILCTDATAFAATTPAFGTPTWTKLSGQGIIGTASSPTSPLTGIGQGENVFMWSVTESGCTARDTVKIYNRRVDVDAGIDQIICSFTSTVNANVPTIGSGSWSIITGGGSFSDMTNPKASVINLARGTNTLRWSINNGGCISYDEMIIRNDLPTNADAGRDTILIVDNYQLAAANPAIGTGQWTLQSGSASVTNPNLYNTTVTGLGIGDNVFRWTVTNNLCYSTDEVKVVNYTPTNTDAGPSQTLCVDYTTMAGTRPNYGTGQWTVVAGSATFKDPFKFDTEVINIGKGSNVYRWTIYEYKVTFDDVTIVNNSPSNANAGIDQRLCTDNAILSANQPIIGTGAWSVIGGSGTITDASKYNSTIGNLGPGSNTFRWTITSGACQSYDEVIVTNDQPTFAEAGGDQIICADSVSLYPNTPTIGIGEWSVVKGSAFFRGNKAFNLSRGENLLRWLISNNGCYSADTVLITSNKPTTAYTGEDKSICVDSIFLPGNAPTYGTGQWTMLSGAGVIQDVNNANSKVTELASGQNRFRWTITYNNCESFSEVDINYNFILADAGDDQILCGERASLNANDAGIGIGQWSVVGGSGSANFVTPTQSNTDVINLDKGTNTLRWTITNSGCVSYDNVVITNNMPTTAYAGSDRSVCGEEIFLNANAAVIGTGEWSVLSGAATIENINLATTKVSNLSVGRNVLRWIISNQNCISFDEVVINNDQPANIEAGPSQYICADTAQLYATAAASGYGRWSILKGSATFEDNTKFNTRVFNLERGENKLVWTVTSAGCSNFDSVTIANNLPSTPSAGPDQDICADNVFMAANTPSIGAGHWSIVSGSAVFENIDAPNSKVTGLGNGPNVLRWLLQNGSCILFDEVTITNSLPTVAYAGEDRAVCNTAATLLANAPVSGKGSWSVVSGYGVFNDPTRHDADITKLGFGPNTLRWTTENGRCRTSDDVVITNNLAEVYAGPDQVVYSPTMRLVGNKPAGGTGEWIVLAGQGTIQNPNSIETTVTGLGGGANTFSWTINNDGCIASDDVVITHRVLPVVSFSPLPAGGCPPLNISFINTSIGGTPFTWDFGDGSTSSSTNTDHTYYTPGKYTVRLTATGPDGIMVHKDSVIIIREIPVAQAEITPDIAYIPGNSVNFFNLSNNIDSLLWEFGDGNTSTEKNPTHRYENPGAYDVTLHVWSGYQCYDSLVLRPGVIVERAGIINCPNAFTPNLNGPTGGNFNQNDFSNDVFHCYVDGVTEYHLEIYNRLGIRLFTSDDINTGWDGYFKGKLVEEGAYVFKVYGRYNNGQMFNFVGNIVVLH